MGGDGYFIGIPNGLIRGLAQSCLRLCSVRALVQAARRAAAVWWFLAGFAECDAVEAVIPQQLGAPLDYISRDAVFNLA